MNISTLLSGAGQVSTGVREREDELRRAREDQLRLEALNRQNRARQIDTQATVAPAPDFGPMRPRQDVGVAPPSAALPAPAPAAAGVRVKPADNPTTTVGKVPTAAPAPTEPLPMTQAEFMALPPERRAQILQTENDRRLLKAAAGFPVAGAGALADLATAPYRGYAMAAEGIANSRVGRALGITNPGQRMEVFGSGTASGLTGDEKSFPLAAKGTRMITDNMLPLSEEDYIKTLPATNSKVRPTRGGPARRKNAAGGLAVPGKAASGSSQYDKPTQYDALIQQAAIQNGLDPVIFKRLLGTESSFNPEAVSPRGKSFGLGIAQIADVHGLSDAQRLDPNIAIPAGAKIFAQYLNAAGGDYEEAMMKYKGAVSDKGRASMAPIIASILNGVSPVATAQADEMPQPVATLAATGPALQQAVAQGGGAVAVGAPATSQPSIAEFYLSNPQAIGRDVRLAQQQRDELVRMAQMYQQSGMGDEYRQVRHAIMALDNQTANLLGIQAVQEMEFANDPTRLSQMLSYVQGQQIDLKPYNNGTFDIIINGVTAHKNVPGKKIKEDALSLFDPQFAAMKAEMAKEAHKGAVADRSEVVKQTAKMIADLRLEQFKGDVQMQIEYLKKTTGWDVKPDTNTGLVYIIPPNEREPLVWSPEGRTIERDGEKITINSAQPIAGLR